MRIVDGKGRYYVMVDSLAGDYRRGILALYKRWTGKDATSNMVVLNNRLTSIIDRARGNKVVAVAQLVIMPDPFFGRYWGLVEDVYVASAYRERGLGRMLMEAVEVDASSIGCEFIKLTTRKPLGMRLYRALGYDEGLSFYKNTDIRKENEALEAKYGKVVNQGGDYFSIVPKVTKVVVAGAFDPLHEGHIEHLNEAAKLGDYLIAIVGSDSLVAKNKNRRPYPLKTRMAVLAPWVDGTVVANGVDGSVADVLKTLKPDIFAKGGDRTKDKMPEAEIKACEDIGCKLVYEVGRQLNSSTKLREGVMA